MHLFGNPEVERAVRPTPIIKMHRLFHRSLGLLFSPLLPAQAILAFENPIDPLGQRVLRTMVALSHADPQPALLESAHILVTTILAPAIGVVNRIAIIGQFSQRAVQSSQAALRF